MLTRVCKSLRRNLEIALVFGVAGLLFIVASSVVPGFSSLNSIRNLVLQVLTLCMVAGGQTFIVLTGGVDLSIPWMMTTSAVLTAYLTVGKSGALVWVIPVALAIAVGVGLFNGFGVSILKIPPMVMTLATNTILNGALVLFVGVAPPARSPELLVELVHGRTLGIPRALIIIVVTSIVLWLLLSFTGFGRRLYAVGTNMTVAKFSGIEPVHILLGAYALCSVFAALAGLMFLGYVGTAYLGMGDRYQFMSIAAVIVGGASVLGGSGHFLGTLAGAILMTVLSALLIVFNLSAGAISLFYGVVILVSVWLSSLRAR